MINKICKNCSYWKPCGLFNDKSHFKVCTNENVFVKKPSNMFQFQLVNESDFSSVLTSDKITKDTSLKNEEPILTGENFGCIHFENKK